LGNHKDEDSWHHPPQKVNQVSEFVQVLSKSDHVSDFNQVDLDSIRNPDLIRKPDPIRSSD
jgi:hypothetical protein